MSTTRMMILGLVKWLQPVHGYHVRRELMSWQVDQWANLQPGSIYHALRKLTEAGLLEEVATEQVGARPARTTYRITPAGDREFEDLLRKYWWEYREAVDPFGPAFAFLQALPRREAAAALRNRARVLDARAAEVDALIGAVDQAPDKPVHVAWMLELDSVRSRAEAEWCRRVADRVEAGQGSHVGEFDSDDLGRRWREAITAEFGSSDDTE